MLWVGGGDDLIDRLVLPSTKDECFNMIAMGRIRKPSLATTGFVWDLTHCDGPNHDPQVALFPAKLLERIFGFAAADLLQCRYGRFI